ncbi:hypothetical protein OE88DRAFT_144821 [Heliocybe sulcata]|uniref:Uncharacterized protein n=1 Tax=Heliocybe sulcata TaxID=5364 RepID=A0A5C3NJX0_9AGAM|nr:hypothetical protein OE88DRAFT_144821 [Heliocybe sulcata]
MAQWSSCQPPVVDDSLTGFRIAWIYALLLASRQRKAINTALPASLFLTALAPSLLLHPSLPTLSLLFHTIAGQWVHVPASGMHRVMYVVIICGVVRPGRIVSQWCYCGRRRDHPRSPQGARGRGRTACLNIAGLLLNLPVSSLSKLYLNTYLLSESKSYFHRNGPQDVRGPGRKELATLSSHDSHPFSSHLSLSQEYMTTGSAPKA